jgi:hypothetical protein
MAERSVETCTNNPDQHNQTQAPPASAAKLEAKHS